MLERFEASARRFDRVAPLGPPGSEYSWARQLKAHKKEHVCDMGTCSPVSEKDQVRLLAEARSSPRVQAELAGDLHLYALVLSKFDREEAQQA